MTPSRSELERALGREDDILNAFDYDQRFLVAHARSAFAAARAWLNLLPKDCENCRGAGTFVTASSRGPYTLPCPLCIDGKVWALCMTVESKTPRPR